MQLSLPGSSSGPTNVSFIDDVRLSLTDLSLLPRTRRERVEAEVPGKGREKAEGKRWGRKRKRYFWEGWGWKGREIKKGREVSVGR